MVWGSIARAVGRAFSRTGAGRAATRRIITSTKRYVSRISAGVSRTTAKTTSRVGSAYRYSRSLVGRSSGTKSTGLGRRRRRMEYEYAYKY